MCILHILHPPQALSRPSFPLKTLSTCRQNSMQELQHVMRHRQLCLCEQMIATSFAYDCKQHFNSCSHKAGLTFVSLRLQTLSDIPTAAAKQQANQHAYVQLHNMGATSQDMRPTSVGFVFDTPIAAEQARHSQTSDRFAIQLYKKPHTHDGKLQTWRQNGISEDNNI